jgi:hypothetical protein
MEYHVSTNPGPGSPILQFAKAQYTGKLIDSGDGITFDAVLIHFDPSGINTGHKTFKGNGKRIPLEIVLNTSQNLPIPAPPQWRATGLWRVTPPVSECGDLPGGG